MDLPAHLTGDDAQAYVLGANVFMRDGHCVTCHQKTGAGLDPIYPPLAGSPWVTGSEERLTKLVLHGLWGPIEVNGKTYDPAKGIPPMTQFAALLKDEEIAAVLTYVGQRWHEWKNPVDPALVAQVRKETAERKQPWTHEELKTVAK